MTKEIIKQIIEIVDEERTFPSNIGFEKGLREMQEEKLEDIKAICIEELQQNKLEEIKNQEIDYGENK